MDYWEMLMEHLKENPGLLEPGKLHHVYISHKANCPIWAGGACNCSPAILSGPAVNAKFEEEE